MLNAIIHGKSGRIDSEGGTGSISWRQLYKQREDLLTAAFFSRFTYLSGLLQHRLLKSWLGGIGDFTAFQSVEYWPRYDLPDNEKRVFVEPDLLLRFEDCDVLVEVKPPQGGRQYIGQWKNEIEGYFAQDSELKPLYFLAVGKVDSVPNISVVSKNICKEYDQLEALTAVRWNSIAHGLYQLLRSSTLDAQDSRVVEDMLQALSLYGIQAYEMKWSDLELLYTEKPLDLSVMILPIFQTTR